jgi:hypothetical protein
MVELETVAEFEDVSAGLAAINEGAIILLYSS